MIRARGSVWIDKQNAFQPRAIAVAVGFTYSSGNIICHDSYTIKQFLGISIHTPPRIYIENACICQESTVKHLSVFIHCPFHHLQNRYFCWNFNVSGTGKI